MLEKISDPADPRIAAYTGLRGAHLSEEGRTLADGPGDTFIAEGRLVVEQLIESGLPVRSVLGTGARLEVMREALLRLDPAVPVYAVDQQVLNAIAGFNIHRGILAQGRRPAPPDLDRLLATARSLVILEDLSNHDNIGGIFRATAALAGLPRGDGGSAVLLSPRCADPLYRKAIRVSMGTVLRLPFAMIEPWPGVLHRVKAAGFTLLALTPAPDALTIEGLAKVERPALMLGAEGPGLSEEALAAADLRVRIPIDPRVDSLNVVTAAAIALHRFGGA